MNFWESCNWGEINQPEPVNEKADNNNHSPFHGGCRRSVFAGASEKPKVVKLPKLYYRGNP